MKRNFDKRNFEITVMDRILSTDTITLNQVRSYLEKTGWTKTTYSDREYKKNEITCILPTTLQDVKIFLGHEVENIAWVEKRLPSEVLADISKEKS